LQLQNFLVSYIFEDIFNHTEYYFVIHFFYFQALDSDFRHLILIAKSLGLENEVMSSPSTYTFDHEFRMDEIVLMCSHMRRIEVWRSWQNVWCRDRGAQSQLCELDSLLTFKAGDLYRLFSIHWICLHLEQHLQWMCWVHADSVIYLIFTGV